MRGDLADAKNNTTPTLAHITNVRRLTLVIDRERGREPIQKVFFILLHRRGLGFGDHQRFDVTVEGNEIG